MQACIDDAHDERAVVTPHCHNALGIHLVPLRWLRPVESRIPLLVDQQIGVIHLLKFQLDGLDKLACHILGGLFRQRHNCHHIAGPEAHHDGVCVTVNDLGVVAVSVADLEPVAKGLGEREGRRREREGREGEKEMEYEGKRGGRERCKEKEGMSK